MACTTVVSSLGSTTCRSCGASAGGCPQPSTCVPRSPETNGTARAPTIVERMPAPLAWTQNGGRRAAAGPAGWIRYEPGRSCCGSSRRWSSGGVPVIAVVQAALGKGIPSGSRSAVRPVAASRRMPGSQPSPIPLATSSDSAPSKPISATRRFTRRSAPRAELPDSLPRGSRPDRPHAA